MRRGWRDWLGEALHSVREAVDPNQVEEQRVELSHLSPREAAGELPGDLAEALVGAELVSDGAGVTAWREVRAQLDDALQRFGRGRRMALAVTAPAGAGSPVLLEELARIARRAGGRLRQDRIRLEEPVSGEESQLARALARELELPPADALAELRQPLLEGPRRMVVVAQGHHLYLRTIGGFDVLRRALSLLSSTLERVLWVVELDAIAWSYLDQVLQLSSYFDLVVEVPPLEVEDLRGAFERVMSVLGGRFQFQFLRPVHEEGLEPGADWRNEVYWRRLTEASRGNPRAAASLFLQGLRWSEQRQLAYVLPPPDYPVQQVLGGLAPTSLLALALILEHGALAGAQLADLLLLNVGEAQAILDDLERRSVVAPQGDPPVWAVHPPWQAGVVEELAERNLL